MRTFAHTLSARSRVGTERLMFGSDWPVTTLAVDYQSVFDQTMLALDKCSTEDRQDVLADTAIRFYNLDVEPQMTGGTYL